MSTSSHTQQLTYSTANPGTYQISRVGNEGVKSSPDGKPDPITSILMANPIQGK